MYLYIKVLHQFSVKLIVLPLATVFIYTYLIIRSHNVGVRVTLYTYL